MSIKKKAIVIGSGFTATVTTIALILKNYEITIIYPNDYNKYNHIINSKFSHSKIFKKGLSFFFRKININKEFKLIEQSLPGGHSKIWGGFFDNSEVLSSFSNKIINEIEKYNISLVSQSIASYHLNQKRTLYKWSCDGKTANFSLILKKLIQKKIINYIDAFATISKDMNNNVFLKTIPNSSIYINIKDNRYIIFDCSGIVSLLNLSATILPENLIQKGTLKFSHYSIKLFSISKFYTNFYIIVYNLSDAFEGFTGKKIKFLKIINFIKIIQLYSCEVKANFKLNVTSTATEINFTDIDKATMPGFKTKAGKSVHIGCIEFDGKPIQQHISSLTNGNLIMFGSGTLDCVPQGPISQDILKQISAFIDNL
jgi:hypothetical protein